MLRHLYMFFGKGNREKAFTQTGFSNFHNVAKNYGLDERRLRVEFKSFIDSYQKIKEVESQTSTNRQKKDIDRESFIATLPLI